MTKISGADAAVRMLQHHGVKHIFGLCGDTSLPFYDALARLDHGIDHVLTRDERSAAYMADAYARVTGRVGICEGPSGGGATYILPGVIEANESSVAMVSITSDVPVTARGRYPLTALDQKALFAPLTKWNTVVDDLVGEAVLVAESVAGRPPVPDVRVVGPGRRRARPAVGTTTRAAPRGVRPAASRCGRAPDPPAGGRRRGRPAA